MTDRDGKRILGADGKPIMTRDCTYVRPDVSKVLVQDHSGGLSLCRVELGTKARISMCAHQKTHEPDQYLEQTTATPGKGMSMTCWIELVLDAAPVKAIFGPTAPSLDGVDVHEIVLHRDGPRVMLRFDLRDFPVHPPKKWVVAGFNRVQLRLLAVGIQDLQIAGMRSNIQVNLGINKNGGLIRLHADNGAVRFGLGAEALIVDGISGYRDDSVR